MQAGRLRYFRGLMRVTLHVLGWWCTVIRIGILMDGYGRGRVAGLGEMR